VERFSYEGYEFRDRGRGIDEDIPYILFPRQALILDERPLLRWHDTGAASYTVSLETGGEPIWEDDTVTGTELRYPNDAPALEVGNSYHLVVQDNTTSRSSLEDATRGTGFRLAAEAEREFIEQQRERLAGLDALDEAEQQLALAVYLISRTPDDPPAFGYWGEAWLRLEAAAQVHDTPAVWRWQGEALRAMRLPNEAEHAYQQALQQAEVQGSMEEQAAALAGLWYVTDDQRYFDEAIRLYEELGDEQQAEALREAQ
jgi:tetratricopeptide (TPR) repeat protein